MLRKSSFRRPRLILALHSDALLIVNAIHNKQKQEEKKQQQEEGGGGRKCDSNVSNVFLSDTKGSQHVFRSSFTMTLKTRLRQSGEMIFIHLMLDEYELWM